MKRLISIMLTAFMALTLMPAQVFAAQDAQQALPAKASFVLNGTEVTLDAYNIGNSNYIKLRDIAKLLGFEISYDEITNSVTINSEFITYENAQYGFKFTLPKSWENYSVLTEKWEGSRITDYQGNSVAENGPMIKIRHPLWTSQNQRQDIPIMIFTLNQWEDLQSAELIVGAAPMPPSELGRNAKYVFALPARFDYAFPEGYQEVESILEDKPLQPM